MEAAAIPSRNVGIPKRPLKQNSCILFQIWRVLAKWGIVRVVSPLVTVVSSRVRHERGMIRSLNEKAFLLVRQVWIAESIDGRQFAND